MRPVEQSEVEYFKAQKALYNDTGEFQISISDADIKHGSPKIGDMIARNPDNHDDVWLIAKEYFQKHFAPVADVPRQLTPEHISDCVADVQMRKMGLKTTVCLITLTNGFEIVGTSGCVDPDNYDFNIGAEIARKNAIDKIWELEGYLLQQRIYDQGHADR